MSNSQPRRDANGDPVLCASCGSQCFCDPIWYSGPPQRCDSCIVGSMLPPPPQTLRMLREVVRLLEEALDGTGYADGENVETAIALIRNSVQGVS